MPKKTFILHDETVNTQGFRMLTSGADLSVFENNPVMLLNHDDWNMPIGRWENIRVEGTGSLPMPCLTKTTKGQSPSWVKWNADS